MKILTFLSLIFFFIINKKNLIFKKKKSFTKNGWLIFDNIVFSEIIWSTYFKRKISAFLSIFKATYSPEDFYFASLTLPKEPFFFLICCICCFFLIY